MAVCRQRSPFQIAFYFFLLNTG